MLLGQRITNGSFSGARWLSIRQCLRLVQSCRSPCLILRHSVGRSEIKRSIHEANLGLSGADDGQSQPNGGMMDTKLAQHLGQR